MLISRMPEAILLLILPPDLKLKNLSHMLSGLKIATTVNQNSLLTIFATYVLVDESSFAKTAQIHTGFMRTLKQRSPKCQFADQRTKIERYKKQRMLL